MSDSKAPAYLMYPSDFQADEHVQLMDISEEGAYRRLLDSAWMNGSIPNDIAKLAAIVRVDKKRMAKMWPAIAPCWHEVEGDPSRLVNGRQERERAKYAERRARSSRGGKIGSQKRWGTDKGTQDLLTPESLTLDNLSNQTKPSNTTTAGTGADARGQADDAPLAPDELDLPPSPLDAVPISVLDFGRWFTQQGVENGAVDGHHILDGGLDFARRYGGLEAAGKLIAAYGLDECKTRSLRLFAAVRDGKNQRNPSISTLSSVWSKPDIAGTPAAAAAPKLHPSSQRLLDTVAAIRRSQSA